MSKRITQEELESYLWGSAVLLRTSIDAGAYKQYIFPLLFFKRISDVYDEETYLKWKNYKAENVKIDIISSICEYIIFMVLIIFNIFLSDNC